MATKPTEQLIYDRTLQDLNFDNEKGNYNYTDLNRVMAWQKYISDLLNEKGYGNTITILGNFVMGQIPHMSEFQTYKQNIVNLRNAFYVKEDTPTPPTPSKNSLTIDEANAIEKILYDMEYLIDSLSSVYIHSGVSRAGQSHVWQSRFRYKPYRWRDVKDLNAPLKIYSVESTGSISTLTNDSSVYESINYINEFYNNIDRISG